MATNAGLACRGRITGGDWSISSQDSFERDVSLLVSGRELAPSSNSLTIAEENISIQLINSQQYGRGFRRTYGKGAITRVKNASSVVAQW
jgi:hypothetical protein